MNIYAGLSAYKLGVVEEIQCENILFFFLVLGGGEGEETTNK